MTYDIDTRIAAKICLVCAAAFEEFLEVSALEDWSKVRPAIFGNLFESAIDATERHAHGIRFTSEADIMKIVRPTISRYWEERIKAAGTIAQLSALQTQE